MNESKEESAEDLLSRAMDLAGQAYKEHVKDLAQEFLDAIVSGDIEDRETLFERVAERVDSDGWVIWNNKAKLVLLVSSNAEHGLEDGLVDTSSFKDGIPWNSLAYCALEQDVYEVLHDMGPALGIDINADDLWDEDETDLFEEVRDALREIVKKEKKQMMRQDEDWEPRDSQQAISDALEGKQPRLANHGDFISELEDLYKEQWEESPDVGAD